jgi:hypothetical protein
MQQTTTIGNDTITLPGPDVQNIINHSSSMSSSHLFFNMLSCVGFVLFMIL